MLEEAKAAGVEVALNESPSEKEGKCNHGRVGTYLSRPPSMKVPPKRKGNDRVCLVAAGHLGVPQ